MEKNELIQKIILKKEFSQIPLFDVERIFSKFNNSNYIDEEKIKLTRNLLRKVYSTYSIQKLLNLRYKSENWILKKHVSTRERYFYYLDVYKRILKDFKRNLIVFDLGCGVNGFSYSYLSTFKFKIKYIGIEAVKQFVDLQNDYFKIKDLNAKVYHQSLFELGGIKKTLLKESGQKVVFLFKVLDSLEIVEKDYSKKLLKEIIPLVDRVVVSFATKSLISKKNFKINRKWFYTFVKENFFIHDDFEFGGEKYICFSNKKV